MNYKYIGTNNYKYRHFKSPLGFTKVLLYIFIDRATGWGVIGEYNVSSDSTEDQIESFVKEQIERIENME